ncbi:50S ribosomal protein L9 [Patescibacteria group bacterium]
MKVILLQNIKKIGKKRDVKSVKDGYAINYLFPNKLAVMATDDELDKLEEFKEEEIQQAEEELIGFQKIASELDGLEIEISSKVDDSGKLFGSITSNNITDKLKESGFEIEKKWVKLKDPIKELGEYEIDIELPHNLEAKIKIVVIAAE